MISLGFIIGLLVAGVLLATAVVLFAWSARWRRRHDRDALDWDLVAVLRIGALVFAGIVLVVTGFGLFPYDMQYHRYTHVTGTVDAVEARMLADGKATTQNYAVRMKDSHETYRCDDTRCSLLKTGDHVELWCIREWQYASTPGWDCRFDKTTAGAR